MAGTAKTTKAGAKTTQKTASSPKGTASKTTSAKTSSSAKAAYEFILREVNEFLAELGILTLTVEIGEKVPDDDDFPYELKPFENFTSDFDKKDSVVEIERYAYVFNEGRGVENFPVCEGSAVVMIYGNSGR